ncbi:MAG: helix-turn-helix transcriptional regulator [Clostridia bacterium]|nr:helix-turn-helix transcriptional regulator [Clostridia bacterium]
MVFDKNAVVTELWAYKFDYKKHNMQYVAGREFNSLSLRISGKAAFEVGQHAYTAKANDITFMPAGVGYRTRVDESGSMYLIQFKTQPVRIYNGPIISCVTNPEIAAAFSELCDIYSSDGENRYKCMSLIYSLFDMMNRPVHPIPKRMRVAKSFIDNNFSSPISVASLAKDAELSEVYFRNEFKKYFSKSPLAYLKTVRVNNAKQLLRSGNCTISEIAVMCGFESISYFSYEFKRMTGISPTEYKNKN